MESGDREEILIGDVAFGGDGVGRIDEFVLFVPFAVDGDEAEVEITEVKKRYARGRLVRIVTPSASRVTPPCPYYGRCGGCRMQHIAYAHQLELKRRQVEQTFRRIAKLSPAVAPVIPSPRPYGYRGKAEFHLTGGRGGRRVGLMAWATNDVVEVERCAICDDSLNRKLAELRERPGRGDVRPEGDRQVIWSDEPGEPATEMVTTASGKAPDLTRIVRGKRLTVPSRGFFQANIALVGDLVDQVVGMCALSGGETVVDAYGGAGLFSLFLGARAGRLIGIEGEREAVRCAVINLRREGLGQAEFFMGDVADVLDREVLRRRTKVDVVVLDPPRDGCGGEVIGKAAAIGPERIVYVSCNPATQARDIGRLAECGYTLRRLQPLDLFPQTAHIEVVALLTRG